MLQSVLEMPLFGFLSDSEVFFLDTCTFILSRVCTQRDPGPPPGFMILVREVKSSALGS